MTRDDEDTRDMRGKRKRKLSPASRQFKAMTKPPPRGVDDTGSFIVHADQQVNAFRDTIERMVSSHRAEVHDVLRERDAAVDRAEYFEKLLRERHTSSVVTALTEEVKRLRDALQKARGGR